MFTNIWFLGVFAVVALAGGVVLSIYQSNLDWIGAAGSIWTLIAAIAASRKIIRMGYAKWRKDRHITNGGVFPKTKEYEEEERQEELDDIASALSACMAILSVPLQIAGYAFNLW